MALNSDLRGSGQDEPRYEMHSAPGLRVGLNYVAHALTH